MKLCLVTETFPPEVNGVAMTLERLMSQLTRDGHEVLVCRPRQSSDAESKVNGVYQFAEVTFPGLPIICYPGLRIGLPGKRKLKALWQANRPDVVHVATEGPLGQSAVAAARSLGIPLVTTFHTNFQDYLEHYRMGWLKSACVAYLRGMHNKALCNMAPDQSLMQTLSEYGFKSVERLGRGVDTELFDPKRRDLELRASWGATEADPVYIHVSRVAKEKNIPFVLDTFRKIRTDSPNAKCVIVGDGPVTEKLKKQYPECIFAGMRFGEDLARHYASADIFLFGSTTETFGNVITEAMASELIVLAYDYAAAKQYIVDGVNGFSAEAFDAQDFEQKAMVIARNWQAFSNVRSAARVTTFELPWSKIIESYLQTLVNCGALPRAVSRARRSS